MLTWCRSALKTLPPTSALRGVACMRAAKPKCHLGLKAVHVTRVAGSTHCRGGISLTPTCHWQRGRTWRPACHVWAERLLSSKCLSHVCARLCLHTHGSACSRHQLPACVTCGPVVSSKPPVCAGAPSCLPLSHRECRHCMTAAVVPCSHAIMCAGGGLSTTQRAASRATS